MINVDSMSAMADEFRKIAAAQKGAPAEPAPVSNRLTWGPGSAFLTPAGSMVHGVPARGEDPEGDAFIDSRAIQDLVHHAEGALRQGKKVVCLCEGGVQGSEKSEQRALADAIDQLHRKPQYAGKIRHDSWDDEDVRAIGQNQDGHFYIDRKSAMFKKLVQIFKDPDLVDAALQAGLSGTGKGQTGKILASAEAQSKLLTLGAQASNQKKLLELAHPDRQGGERTQLSAVMEHYHHERRKNMVKKLKEYEARGYAAVMMPHHAHLPHVQAALRS